MSGFPVRRMRRLRATERLRALVRETTLDVSRLVMPLFVRPGKKLRRPIPSMSSGAMGPRCSMVRYAMQRAASI